MLKKLIDKIFGKRCVCKTKSVCDHLNVATKKDILMAKGVIPKTRKKNA